VSKFPKSSSALPPSVNKIPSLLILFPSQKDGKVDGHDVDKTELIKLEFSMDSENLE
jgi:hypothetical protein